MNSESVDLIATDPPFNKGRDFHATPDSLADGASFQDRWSWDEDVDQEWVDQITDDFPKVMNVINGSRNSYGDDMGAYLCYMAVRLLEMRRVLREDGSIYLHCDHTASHYLKELMDAVFDYRNFRNEIVWGYKTGGVPREGGRFARKHEILLFYSKNHKKIKFNKLKELSYTRTLPEPHTKSGKQLGVNRDHLGKHRYVAMRDWWVEYGLNSDVDITPLYRNNRERTGYPTQKPLSLYERIIKASSNEGDVVLDPFAGCATTCVAAERLNRQWVGIDIWDKAYETVIDRLQKEGMLEAPGGDKGGWLFTAGEIEYTTEPPIRTDDGDVASPVLKTKLKVDEPKGPRMSRAEMVEYLLDQQGWKCQGCDREFDDPRFLELDHNTPRSDGGLNHISNRILLCGPCNKLKSNTYTLSGLRRQNKKLGYMAGESNSH